MRVVSLLLFLVNVAFGAENLFTKKPDFVQPIPVLKLTNGATLRNVTVVRYDRDTVLLKSDGGGTSPLGYSYIPMPLRGQMIAARDRAKGQKSSDATAAGTPMPFGAPPANKVMTPKEKDARRAGLSAVIRGEQSVMDQYEKQSSFKKGSGISEEEYERAKARRDAAQKERDELANH